MVINFGAGPAVPQTRQQTIYQPRRPAPVVPARRPFGAPDPAALAATMVQKLHAEVKRLQAENAALKQSLAKAVAMLRQRAAPRGAPTAQAAPVPAAEAVVEVSPEAGPKMSTAEERAWFSGGEDDVDLGLED